MSDQDHEKVEASGNRAMWIATAVIVVILVGGMGINFLTHHDTLNNAADGGSMSGTTTPK